MTNIIEAIQARGERITLPRRLVIDAIGRAHTHQTINDIQQQIDTPAHPINATTIYRVLQWLKNLGYVSQTDMGQAGIVYSLISRPYHHHLICVTCGRVLTLDDTLFAGVRERLRADYGFETRIEHMAIYGICETCRSHDAEMP